MLCGWESNRRSGVALAMRHRLSGIATYGLNGLRNGDEHPPTLQWSTAPLPFSGFVHIEGNKRVNVKTTAETLNLRTSQ